MPVASRSRRPATGLYVLLAIVFLIAVTYHLRETIDRAELLRHGTTMAARPFDVDLPQIVVSETRPESERAGVRAGDAIVGVADRPVRGALDVFRPLRH